MVKLLSRKPWPSGHARRWPCGQPVSAKQPASILQIGIISHRGRHPLQGRITSVGGKGGRSALANKAATNEEAEP